MTDHKIYNHIDEWYFPDIDYKEFMDNIQWTRTRMSDIMQRKTREERVPGFTIDYNFPLKSVMFHEHDGMWDDPKNQKFQFFNKQFNDELSKVIKDWKPKKVLEVGAG